MRQILVERGVLEPNAEDHIRITSNGPDGRLSGSLIWVLRGLAAVGAIWGLFNTIGALNVANSLDEYGMGEDARSAASLAVFASVIMSVAVVTIPLALAEMLRLCVVIERNIQIVRTATDDETLSGKNQSDKTA